MGSVTLGWDFFHGRRKRGVGDVETEFGVLSLYSYSYSFVMCDHSVTFILALVSAPVLGKCVSVPFRKELLYT